MSRCFHGDSLCVACEAGIRALEAERDALKTHAGCRSCANSERLRKKAEADAERHLLAAVDFKAERDALKSKLDDLLRLYEEAKARVAELEAHLRQHDCDFMHTEPKSTCWCHLKGGGRESGGGPETEGAKPPAAAHPPPSPVADALTFAAANPPGFHDEHDDDGPPPDSDDDRVFLGRKTRRRRAKTQEGGT